MTVIITDAMNAACAHARHVPGPAVGRAAAEPRGAAASENAAAPRRPAGPKKIPARIAIIDDESLNIQVVQKYLQDAGYERVLTTSDATKALDLVLRERPDLILLDIMMPVISGLDILQALQATEAPAICPCWS